MPMKPHSDEHSPFRRWRTLLLVACLVGLADGMSPARAQLTPCEDINQPGLKLVLDQLAFSETEFANDHQFKIFLRKLQFKLRNKLRSLAYALPETNLTLVLCKQRQPSDAQDFHRQMSDELNARGVVLEMWGLLEATRENNRITGRRAYIDYVLIPLRYYEYDNRDLNSIYSMVYPPASPAETVPFADLLSQAIEIDAFTTIGIGLKFFKADRFDEALKYFCKGNTYLVQAMKIAGSPLNQQDPQRLAAYVSTLAGQAIKAAQSDSTYQGGLRLLDPAKPCPEALP